MSGAETPNEGPRAPGAEGASYDEIRQRLRSLGYLNRPLERFLLSGLAGKGSFARRHAAVSARVAVVAAPLLGLVFALAVVLVNRPRFSAPLDSLVLVLYFSVVFGAAVFALEFGSGLVLAGIVRWRGKGMAATQATAARAGFAVSLVLTIYLAIWWRGRAAGAGRPLEDLLGLAALVMVNAALLRVSSLASMAALVRASDLPPAPAGPSRLGGGAFAALAALVLTVGFFVSPQSLGPGSASPFERTPVAGRLVVLGWDGITAASMDTLVREGRSALWMTGRGRAVLARIGREPGEREQARPEFWTCIATGRPPLEHGVGDASEERFAGLSSPLGGNVPLGAVLRMLVPGRRVAVSAGLRRARTLWEILGDREGIGVVGWWATWPVPEHAPSGRPFVVVSDRALLGLGRGASWDRGVAPRDFARRLESRLDVDLRMVGEEVGIALGREGRHDRWAEIAGSIDGYAIRVAESILEDRSILDLFVYLPGLDILKYGVRSHSPGASTPNPPAAAAYSRYIERRIAALAERLAPEDWLVVIGDPGRGEGAGSGPRDREEGWILVVGPGTDPSLPTETWEPLDLAPTLLNLRGFPKSREMTGLARTSFLARDWVRRLPPRVVDSLGDAAPLPPASVEDSQEHETLERLRSLGYVR